MASKSPGKEGTLKSGFLSTTIVETSSLRMTLELLLLSIRPEVLLDGNLSYNHLKRVGETRQ